MKADNSKPLIVITGNAGSIGTRICERLADRYAIVGLSIKQIARRTGLFPSPFMTPQSTTANIAANCGNGALALSKLVAAAFTKRALPC